MTAKVGSVIRTDVELFDLPEGAVIRTFGFGHVGEVTEARDEDAKAWQFDADGDRIIPRRVDWAGSDIPTYAHEVAEIERFLPAEVIYPGQCADLTNAPRGQLRCVLPLGHDEDPRSLHWVDPAGPVQS